MSERLRAEDLGVYESKRIAKSAQLAILGFEKAGWDDIAYRPERALSEDTTESSLADFSEHIQGSLPGINSGGVQKELFE